MGVPSLPLLDPGPRYASSLLCVLTTAAPAAAKNRALRSINRPVCECEAKQKARFKAS